MLCAVHGVGRTDGVRVHGSGGGNANARSAPTDSDLIRFQYLVIATGSSYAFPAKIAVTERKELFANYQQSAAAIAASTKILIVGGGPVGVGTCVAPFRPRLHLRPAPAPAPAWRCCVLLRAAASDSVVRLCRTELAGEICDAFGRSKSVTLVHRRPHLLFKNGSPELAKQAEAKLQSLGVQVRGWGMTGVGVAEACV